MNNKNNIINFFVLILFLVSMQSAAQNDAEQLLQVIQDKFNTITDLSANITQSVNGTTNLSGKVYYKKNNKIRFELTNILIVSNGETNWNYSKKENKVIISNYDEVDAGLFSIERIIFEYPEECELSTYNIENQKVLVLIPQTSAFSFNSVKLCITKNNLISRALIDDPASGIVQIDLTNYTLNQNPPDSKFSFTPPEGCKVIDLR